MKTGHPFLIDGASLPGFVLYFLLLPIPKTRKTMSGRKDAN